MILVFCDVFFVCFFCMLFYMFLVVCCFSVVFFVLCVCFFFKRFLSRVKMFVCLFLFVSLYVVGFPF